MSTYSKLGLTSTSWCVLLPLCTHCTFGEVNVAKSPQGIVTFIPLSAPTSRISTSSARASENAKKKNEISLNTFSVFFYIYSVRKTFIQYSLLVSHLFTFYSKVEHRQQYTFEKHYTKTTFRHLKNILELYLL